MKSVLDSVLERLSEMTDEEIVSATKYESYDIKNINDELKFKVVTTPMRIDVFSKSGMDRLNNDINKHNLQNRFKITIEDPLPNTKERGVYKVVYFDKNKIDEYNNNIMWLAIL